MCLCSLGGCVHYGQFRDDARKNGALPTSSPAMCEDDPDANPKRKSIWCPKGESQYYLGFVEVDEFGEMFQRKQLTNAMRLIQKAKSDSKTMDENGSPTNNAVVVVFIHGWKNNASDDTGNVWGFRDALNDIAKNLTREFEARRERGQTLPGEEPEPVVGIYIGWRGAVTNLGVVKEFTFFNRRDAAARIPGAHLTEVLYTVMHETKSCLGSCPTGTVGRGTGSLSVIVGHSFGGLVLERTMTQAVSAEVLDQVAAEKSREARGEKRAEGNYVHLPTDLIVMVNEAAPATESKQFLDLLKTNVRCVIDPATGACRYDHPLFLSITSTGDWATGLTLPLGQGASSLFQKNFRTYENPDPKQIPHQKSYYLHSTAHLPPLFSHLLGPRDDAGIQNALNATGNKTEAEAEDCFPIKSIPHPAQYCLVPNPGRYNDTPYWVTQMGTEFVPDHSQVFRPAFRELLSRIIARKIDIKKPGAPVKPATLEMRLPAASQ
jgi:hypothetical protein